jgi:hypothetical protein
MGRFRHRRVSAPAALLFPLIVLMIVLLLVLPIPAADVPAADLLLLICC